MTLLMTSRPRERAAGNDIIAPPKQLAHRFEINKPKRAYKPKVRTGCLTCKSRKIKCDEAKPACRRCVTTGRHCDGYEAIRAIFFDPESSALERRSFKYFQERASSELAGYYDGLFWNKIVLQASYQYPVIRHCLVAISSLHESLQTVEGAMPLSKQREFSIQQYNKGIKCLTDHKQGKPVEIEVVLLACVLFICYENFESSYHKALTHIENGLSIFDQWSNSNKQKPSVNHDWLTSDITQSLVGILQRLRHQYCSFVKSHEVRLQTEQLRIEEDQFLFPELPEQFTDLYEARSYLDMVLSAVFTAVQVVIIVKDKSRHDAVLCQADSVLNAWMAIFNQFMERSRHRQDVDFQRAATIVRMHATVAFILPRSLKSPHEAIFDDFTDTFAFMVWECKRAIEMDYRDPTANSRRIVFCFDLGMTPVLYLTATRCRDPFIRRQAIELLNKCGRREGVWDSSTAARVAHRLLTIEETACPGPIRTCKDVPEWARVRLISCDAMPTHGKMTLTYIRTPYNPETCPLIKDETIWNADMLDPRQDSEMGKIWNSIYATTFAAIPPKATNGFDGGSEDVS